MMLYELFFSHFTSESTILSACKNAITSYEKIKQVTKESKYLQQEEKQQRVQKIQHNKER